jgi:protein TonB
MLLVVVRPQYPPLAKRARIQGTVRMSAIINKEGKIIELKVIDGHPFLVDAAVEVVRKWRYRPTYLGGEPVEVATQIIMRFHLDQ